MISSTASEGTLYLRWFLPSMALQFVTTAMGATLQGTGVVKPTMIVQLLGLLLACAGYLVGTSNPDLERTAFAGVENDIRRAITDSLASV